MNLGPRGAARLSDTALAAVVSRLALVIALIVATAFPASYAFVAYQDLVEYLNLVAKVKANQITMLITANPELWVYQGFRLQELLAYEPVLIAQETAKIHDTTDRLIARVGVSPDPPVLRRSAPLHESGRVVGRVEVVRSLRGLLFGVALAVAAGLLLGGAVFATLRTLPMRALRRVTDALERNAARLTETLQSQAREIRERERVEMDLRESEERYRSLFELSPDGILIVTKGRIVLVNGMCLKMLGASVPAELLGKRVLHMFHADYRGRVAEQMRRMQVDRLTLPAEERKILQLDGTALDVAVACSPFTHRGQPSIQVVMRDITDKKKTDDRLSYLAQHDSLTGLPNRGLFQDRLEHTVAQAKRNGRSAAVLCLDLDRFKLVNDTLGHAAGNLLLQQVAARIGECIRRGDTVGRFGGDEFGVILLGLAKPDDAAVVAKKINDTLARPFDVGGYETFISASVGIALYPADATDSETLNRNADAAMYRAKELGRNNYQFFTQEMNERAMRRMRMEASMRLALERKEFVLHYQPKVDLASGTICGIEALLRWAHPDGGLVSPAEFIPVLEETGLIVAVGEHVIREACRQTGAWREAGLKVPPMAVNLSARQFQQRNLEDTVGGILRETGLEPGVLQLELTESMLMSDPETAVRTLLRLKEAGVTLSVDDFGTGYSSLAYLKRFPVDELKIDRSFIKDIVTDANDAAITLAIVSLAHSLGLKVVAEGVETEAQLYLLDRYCCDQVQGYHFSRPVPAAELETMLREDRRLAVPRNRARPDPRSAPLGDYQNAVGALGAARG